MNYKFNLGLNQKRIGANNPISTQTVNLGATSGKGSSTRMFNYCKTHNPNPSLCIDEFININPNPTPEPIPPIQKQFIYSFNYDGSLDDKKYIPLINTNSSFIYTTDVVKNSNTYTITINYTFTDKSNTNDGLSFFNVFTFYNNTTNLTINNFGSIPLSRGGSNFANLNNLTFDSNSGVPLILTNTSLANCFINAINFNTNLSYWDVSNVKFMNSMFNGAYLFNNGGVALSWGVKTNKVINMTSMFSGASDFNQDISSWDVSNVATMENMFNEAYLFNNDGVALSWGIKTNNVTNMNSMFNGAIAFNQDISSWDVSNVKFMYSMFRGASAFNQDISSWKVSNVIDMSNMFRRASAFNQDISSWKVSNVINMSNMFSEAKKFNSNISSWDVSNVKTMEGMFASAIAFNQNIGSWDVSYDTNINGMFNIARIFNNGQPKLDKNNPMLWSSVKNYHKKAPLYFSVSSSLTLWDGSNGNSPFTSSTI